MASSRPSRSRPTGRISDTVRPSWSSTARRIASPRAPPTSRCAARPRRYVTGKTSLGAKYRKAATARLTPIRTATTIAVGESTPRWRRASATSATTTATAHFSRLRSRPSGTSV